MQMAAAHRRPGYAIEKLKRAAELDPVSPEIDLNLGVAYLKMGSDKGGEAVEALWMQPGAIRNMRQHIPVLEEFTEARITLNT